MSGTPNYSHGCIPVAHLDRLRKMFQGRRIASNGLYRSFCKYCGAPTATATPEHEPDSECVRCVRMRMQSMAGGGRYGPYKDDPGPGWENTVRIFEDNRGDG